MTEDAPKVRHRAPTVFDYGTLIEDVATLYVNNKLYEGWKNVNVTRTLNSVSGTFNLTLLDRFTIDKLSWELKTGGRAHLHLGKSALFEGFIDSMDVSFSPTARNFTIRGRDRTADLVDCAVLGDSEYQNLNLQQVAEKVVAPFGLKVIVNSDVGAVFPSISVKPGEKVFALLSRLARQRGLLLHSSTHGNLVITKRGSVRAKTELVEGVNVLEASASYDNTERFSQYIVKTQNDGILAGTPDLTAQLEGKASDPGMTRYRPTVIIAETAGDNAMAKTRAQWEATYRAAKAATISVKVADWREKDGSLWDINKLVFLRAPKLGVSDQFLINQVNYELSANQARVATLELIRKDAYDVKPEVNEEDDPLKALGIT